MVSPGIGQRHPFEHSLLDELQLDPQAQHAFVPLDAAVNVGHRQLHVMETAEGRVHAHPHSSLEPALIKLTRVVSSE
jgi:hypothetical protein